MKQSIFDLFPGIQVYDTSPVQVQNPFSGESVELQPEEVAVYDYLKGCELIGDHKGLRKSLDWFMKENPSAYMTLLD
jgi:hypothetical protein